MSVLIVFLLVLLGYPVIAAWSSLAVWIDSRLREKFGRDSQIPFVVAFTIGLGIPCASGCAYLAWLAQRGQ